MGPGSLLLSVTLLAHLPRTSIEFVREKLAIFADANRTKKALEHAIELCQKKKEAF